MAPALDIPTIKNSILSVVLSLSNDKIPNIRFNVAKALEILSIRLGTLGSEGQLLIEQGIMGVLERLSEDGDADVRFFAGKGKGVVRGILEKEIVMSDI